MIALRAALVVGVALASALFPHSAEACSGPGPAFITSVAPKERTNVPLNTRIFVAYSGGTYDQDYAGALTDLLVRPVGGEAVELDLQLRGNAGNHGFNLAVATPVSPLQPNTDYEVLSRIADEPCSECIGDVHAVIATFTTGESNDEDPPTFAGATDATVMGLTSGEDSATCGPYKGAYFTLRHPGASDPNLVGYRVYRDGELVSASGTSGMVLCSGMYIGSLGGNFMTSPGTFYVRAYDLAGNEDANTQGVEVSIDCTQPAQSVLDPSTAEPMPLSGCASVPGSFIASALLWGGVAMRFGRHRVRR